MSDLLLMGVGSSVSSGQPAVKQIAGRYNSYFPPLSGLSTAGEIQTSRLKCVAVGNLTTVSAYYCNGPVYATAANGNARITLTASVEYPAGVFTQLTFSAASSYDLAVGGSIETDDLTIAIPDGATFWIRTCAQPTTAGQQWTKILSTFSGGTGAASGSDQTLSGTIADSTTTCFGPVAIYAKVAKRVCILCVGDSLSVGTNDFVAGASVGDYGWELGSNSLVPSGILGRSIPGTYACLNWCHGGAGIGTYTSANLAKIIDAATKCTHCICELGINDISGTLASNKTAYGAFYTLIAGKLQTPALVYQTTTQPGAVTSTDNYVTATNQTPGANESKRTGFNDWIRAGGIANLTGYVDIAAVIEVDSSNVLTVNGGRWKAPASPLVSGTVTTADINHFLIDSGHTFPTDNSYLGYAVHITSGASSGDSRYVNQIVNAHNLGVNADWTADVAIGDTYELWAVATRDGTHGTGAPISYQALAAVVTAWAAGLSV